MRIGLIDVDSHNFPNLALMKISAWHKAQGDEVEWWWGWGHYDRVYMSKVFDETYTPDIPEPLNADEIIKGGTGYGLDNKLPEEIEHCYPDYSLYPDLTKGKAYGFLTRGCPNNCPFCIVCAKYANEHMDKSDGKQITEDDVFIVWMCKTLQNSKAMVSTTLFDGMYYELTYNGDKKELYLDAYKKWENKCIPVN